MTKQEAYSLIKAEPLDHTGYLALGEVLTASNPKQAYLCYENALFFCKDPEEKAKISQKMKTLDPTPKMAIVILSYNNRKLTEDCLNSIRQHTSEASREIIVIDNASGDDSVEYLRQQPDIILQANEENAGFPKGCNQGIALASPDSDILLLNNDTVVMPNTFFWLRMGLYERETIGSAGSVANSAYFQWAGENRKDMAYYQDFAIKNNVPMERPIENRVTIIGFCMLLKRSVLEKIGYLDEQFSPGNGEDHDLCMRILLGGFENVLVHNSYLVHRDHASFGILKGYSSLMLQNREKLFQKYGFHVDSLYLGTSEMSVSDRLPPDPKDVLEINCGLGATLFAFQYQNPNARYVGIDRHAPTTLFRTQCKNAELYNYLDISFWPLDDRKFDVIYLDTNTIEKRELESFIRMMAKHLKPTGKMVFLVENPFYYTNWIDFLLGGTGVQPGNRETVILKDIENLLPQFGCHPECWIFHSAPGYDGDRKDAIDRILDALPQDRKQAATVKKYSLIASF